MLKRPIMSATIQGDNMSRIILLCPTLYYLSSIMTHVVYYDTCGER